MPKPQLKSFSIVIETENLGMSEFDEVYETIELLERQTVKPELANEVVMTISRHIRENDLRILEKNYPWITFLKLDKEYAYWGAKSQGGLKCTGDIIIFLDIDIDTSEHFVESILYGFHEKKDASVISCYVEAEIKNPYDFAMHTSWMLHVDNDKSQYKQVYGFNLNSFGVLKDVFRSTLFANEVKAYRGNGMFWKNRLNEMGYKIYRINSVHAHHEIPKYWTDGMLRVMTLGTDKIARSQYQQTNNHFEYKFSLFKRIQSFFDVLWYYFKVIIKRFFLLTKRKEYSKYALGSIPIILLNYIFIFIGALISIFDTNFVVDMITKKENLNNA